MSQGTDNNAPPRLRNLRWKNEPELYVNDRPLLEVLSWLAQRIEQCEDGMGQVVRKQPQWCQEMHQLLSKLTLDHEKTKLELEAMKSQLGGAAPQLGTSSVLPPVIETTPDPEGVSQALAVGSPSETRSKGSTRRPRLLQLRSGNSLKVKRTASNQDGDVASVTDDEVSAVSDEDYRSFIDRELLRVESLAVSLRSMVEKRVELQELRDSGQDELMRAELDNIRLQMERKVSVSEFDNLEGKLSELATQLSTDMRRQEDAMASLESRLKNLVAEKNKAVSQQVGEERARVEKQHSLLRKQLEDMTAQLQKHAEEQQSILRQDVEDNMELLAGQMETLQTEMREMGDQLSEQMEKTAVENVKKVTEDQTQALVGSITEALCNVERLSKEVEKIDAALQEDQSQLTGLRKDMATSLEAMKSSNAQALGGLKAEVNQGFERWKNELGKELKEVQETTKAQGLSMKAIEDSSKKLSIKMEDEAAATKEALRTVEASCAKLSSELQPMVDEVKQQVEQVAASLQAQSGRLEMIGELERDIEVLKQFDASQRAFQQKVAEEFMRSDVRFDAIEPMVRIKLPSLESALENFIAESRERAAKMEKSQEMFLDHLAAFKEKIRLLDVEASTHHKLLNHTTESLEELKQTFLSHQEKFSKVHALIIEKAPILSRLTKSSLSLRSLSMSDIDEEIAALVLSLATKCVNVEKSGKAFEGYEYSSRVGQHLAELFAVKSELEVLRRTVCNEPAQKVAGASNVHHKVEDLEKSLHDAKTKVAVEFYQKLVNKLNNLNPEPIQPAQEERVHFLGCLMKCIETSLLGYSYGTKSTDQGPVLSKYRGVIPVCGTCNRALEPGGAPDPGSPLRALNDLTSDENNKGAVLHAQDGIRPMMNPQGSNFVYKGGFKMPSNSPGKKSSVSPPKLAHQGHEKRSTAGQEVEQGPPESITDFVLQSQELSQADPVKFPRI